MSRAAEIQDNMIKRWRDDITRIASPKSHRTIDGVETGCVDLSGILARVGAMVGEAFVAGTTYGLEIAATPRYIVLNSPEREPAEVDRARLFVSPSNIEIVEHPEVPEDTVYAVGSCSCGHDADYHNSRGCIAVSGFAGPECPCTTPAWRLASKATGTGEQP